MTAKADESERLRLRAEHDLLRALVDDSGDGIIVADQDGIIRTFNGAAEKQHGVSLREVSSESWTQTFGLLTLEGEPLPLEQTPLFRALGGVRVEGARWKVRRPDGSIRILSGTASPIKHADGTTLGAVLTTRDETDRLYAEEELRERNHLLALSAEIGVALGGQAPLAEVLQICVAALVRHLDAAFARIWTLSDGGDVLELRASAGMYTHLDGAHARIPVGKFKIGLIAQAREPHLTNQVVGDDRVGDQPWAVREKMVAFAGYPLRLGDRVVGVIAAFARHPLSPAALSAMAAVASGIAQGIERRRAEDRLRVSEGLLSTTLASIGDGLVATDSTGRVTFFNPVAVALTGFTSDEARGRPLDDVFRIIDETTRAVEESPVARVLREGTVVELANHTLLLRRDGTETPVEDSAAPIRGRDGSIVGVVLVFRDGSERRRAEREKASLLEDERRARETAEKANAAKDQFFATISHELRTPLTSILGWVRMMRTRPELQEKGLDTIERNAKAQTQLIADMFDTARIREGKLSIAPVPIFVATAIEAAVDSARPAAAAKGLVLDAEVDPEVGTVFADGERLQQVISNLVSNAMKFTPRGGRVCVSARRIDSSLEICVDDTGEGIAPEFIPHVFERFRQAAPGTAGGLGLGLAIVEHIVELHGGTVHVESEGPGRGSRFSVRLPVQPTLRLSHAQDASASGRSPHEPL